MRKRMHIKSNLKNIYHKGNTVEKHLWKKLKYQQKFRLRNEYSLLSRYLTIAEKRRNFFHLLE